MSLKTKISGGKSIWRRRLLILLTLLAFLAAGVAVYLLLRSKPAPAAGAATDLSTQFSAAHVVGRWKGVRQWSIDARIMRDEGERMIMEGVERGVIYDGDREALTFQAGQAVWQKKRDGQDCNDLALTGGVTIAKDGKTVLKTDKLDWNAAETLLTAPGKVQFTYEGSTAEAAFLTYNAARETVSLAGDVLVHMADGSIMTVEGSVVYNLESGEIEAIGPTSISSGPSG